MIHTMCIMLSNILARIRRLSPRAALVLATGLWAALPAAHAQMALGMIDTKAGGMVYLYTKTKLTPTTEVVIDASMINKCCWRGTGADFRLLNLNEVMQARELQPASQNVDLEESMFVYELLNRGFPWRDSIIATAIIDSDDFVHLAHSKKLYRRIQAKKSGQIYMITMYPGMEGVNLMLHKGKKVLEHYYYHTQ